MLATRMGGILLMLLGGSALFLRISILDHNPTYNLWINFVFLCINILIVVVCFYWGFYFLMGNKKKYKREIKMEKYKDIHQQLESKKNEIMKRVVAIEKDKNKKKGGDPLTANLDEQSLSLENNEVLDALDELSHHELIQINEALVKIAAGTFGYCQTCGDEIAMSRLKAVPYTNLCINCAK